MAQSVVYADLKFAAAMPLTTPTCSTAPDEDESPYENMPPGPVPTVPSPGRWSHRWRIPMGLQAASLLLLLLLVMATVSLGTCYWQVTRSLQDASREHAAEQGRLSQEVSAQEQELEQTRLELARARAELQRAWQEGNSSQQELAVLQDEMQKVQEELTVSKSTVSSLRACVNTDCCPSGWVLYRSKCLFISLEKKSWGQSCDDCREKSAQLLVKGDWPLWTVPDFLQGYIHYWIGDRFQNHEGRSEGLCKKTYNSWSSCSAMYHGKINRYYCKRDLPWICEKPPDLSSSLKTRFPLPAKR